MRIDHRPLRCLAALLLATSLAGTAEAQQRPPQPRAAPQRTPPPPPAIRREAPPPPAVAAPEPPPPPRERRLAIGELGFATGAAFGAEERDILLPLPRSVAGMRARLSLDLDLVAPFPARHAVEVRANGRLLDARAFPEGATRLAFDLPVPVEDLGREVDALRLTLRLVEPGGPAAGTATARPGSHLALLIPDGVVPSVEAMLRLMPARVMVLTRPGALPPAEAAAALRIALALSATGREARIAAAAAPEPARGADGARLWETGAVVVGASAQAAAVAELAGLPVLVIGGEDPEGAARLLEGPWRAAAGGAALATAGAQMPPEAAGALPFSALRGSLAPQEAARAAWSLDLSTRDLPPGTRPEAVQVELNGPPGTERAIASVLLNEVLLGSAALPPDGRLRIGFPVPERLVGLDNRISVLLHRPAAGPPAQLLPGSAIRLGPAPPPAEFLGLPPAMAEGFELLVDAPGGVLAAEALNLPLWLLRALAPAGAPITVTPVEPGTAPRPGRAFLAATREAPAGSAPRLRLDAGRIELTDRRGERLMQVDAGSPLLAAQLLQAEGRPGIWVRSPDGRNLPFLPPAAAPRLDRGDIALLDRQGVALAWATGRPALVAVAYPEARAETSPLLAWRPWVVGVLWLCGVGLVVYAFRRPRREWPG
ncbi:hypothetical protein [Falsiroseomonas sp. CW058]|uniref:hypothetical protein n=1 Tax=Falsiroseomonas sp. CW058 TaxID=3388664 RepID=UPI003D3123DD